MNENKFKSIKSEYKATDLILKCRGNSNALLQKFIDMQHCVDIIPKEHSEGFELCVTLKPFKNPNRCIKHYANKIKDFDKISKKEWFSCYQRIFDISIYTSKYERYSQFDLDVRSLSLLNELNCKMRITLYPVNI